MIPPSDNCSSWVCANVLCYYDDPFEGRPQQFEIRHPGQGERGRLHPGRGEGGRPNPGTNPEEEGEEENEEDEDTETETDSED